MNQISFKHPIEYVARGAKKPLSLDDATLLGLFAASSYFDPLKP